MFFAAELCLSKAAFVEETGFNFIDFMMFTGTHQTKKTLKFNQNLMAKGLKICSSHLSASEGAIIHCCSKKQTQHDHGL